MNRRCMIGERIGAASDFELLPSGASDPVTELTIPGRECGTAMT
jgi:hypothetical protein